MTFDTYDFSTLADLPPELQNLPESTQSQIATTLSNDEASTDEEIVELWTMECSISPEVANAAIKFRSKFFLDPLFELFP